MILAGDAGGTKVRLALFAKELFQGGQVPAQFSCDQALTVEKYASRSAKSLEEIVVQFLSKHSAGKSISAFCIGAPGPVINGTIKTTNLPWQISVEHLASAIGTPRGTLVNDLVATIAAVPVIRKNDFHIIYPGAENREKKVFALIAPGTGLGQAFLLRDTQGKTVPFPSEGGHVEFAPKNDLEIDLLRYLQGIKQTRISIERVLSGPGLANVYYFLRDTSRAEEPAELREEIGTTDPAPVISKHALSGNYPICVQALEIFVKVLGSHAGDLALAMIATGGIFLGGGIPPRILPKLESEAFRSAYLDKGRLSGIVQATPVAVIIDDRAALLGATSIAAGLL